MADSGDDCDLDTLSALLEEDCDDLPSADSNENSPAVKDSVQSLADGSKSKNSTAEEEEMDMEALSSMLEQDSDLEDNTSSRQGQQEVTADDIAAFLNQSSDSEHEGEEEKDSGQETDKRQQLHRGRSESGESSSSRAANGSDSPRLQSPGSGDSGSNGVMDSSQQDAKHVKNLQDELAMMQQRMMEIQQMLASSQTSTLAGAAAVPSPRSVTQTNSSTVKRQAKPTGSSKTSSTSSSVSTSSPSSSKTSSGSNKRIRPPSASPALRQPEKKQAPGYSNSVAGTEKRKIHAISTTSRGSTNCAVASSRPHSSSDSKRQPSAASRKGDSAAKSSAKISAKISDRTKKEQIQTVNSSQSRDVREDKACGGGKKRPSSTFLTDVAEKAGRETSSEGQSLKSKLFGDADSDSDWEDMDGEKGQLNSSGQEIKRLLQQGQRQRVAHTPSYTVSPSTASWKSRAAPSSTQGPGTSANPPRPSVPISSGGSSAAVKREADTRDCMTEKFSGLRIINPKVSSIMLASKMEGRRLIAPSTLHLKVKCPELQSDWVTIGVMVSKSEARKSQTGKTYSIWKLSDLQSTDTTVSFFLFGQVYKQLWKMDVGNVIGVLNPNIMDAMEKGGGDVAFTVNNAQQVMEIGQSKDLGWCIGKTKRGATCTNFINKKMGDFCTYHVQAAYRKQSAKRSELHGSCPGTTPKSSLKSKILQNNTFFYGGECYTASKGGGAKGKKDKVTLGKLQAVMTQQDRRKVNTLAIQNLMPAHTTKVQNTLTSQHQQPFLDMLSVPTAGSMNLVRHIATAEENTPGVKKVSKGAATTFQSINAIDLLKQHREQIAERIHSRKQQLKMKTSQQNGHRVQNSQSVGQPQCTSPRLSEQACAADKGVCVPTASKTLEKNKTPMLGKGFYPGGKIDLFAESSASSVRKPAPTDVAKRKAIQKVQAVGGLEKRDPNAMRTATQNTDKIKKRVLENIENEHKKAEDGGDGPTTANQSAAEPPRKRSRLLGNVDPNSAEVKQLLNARSSHTGALAQAEAEREERYFDNLEKKEMMEEKMKSITAMEVTVVTCEQCKYTAMSQGDRCKQGGHVVRRHKGKRRFFACKKCKHRTVSLQRYPTDPCKKCGELSYEKTSMYKEKTGPKTESEILCLRGDESKFTSSMDQKVFMSTIVQD